MVTAAGIYARISNDPEGDRLDVNRQVDDCRAEAERRAWPVADLYVDDDKSAWSGTDRPEYRRLLDDIAAHRIDAVLFWHPDRLTRQPIQMEQFIEVCRRAKLDDIAWIGGELAGRDDDGLLLLRILGAVASDASAKTSKRIRRKNDERALAGLPTGGGTRPFGYRDARRSVDPVEAVLVHEAADRALAGDSLRAIATDWNARGVVTATGGRWTLQTLRRMLYAPRLSAQREHRGEIVAKGQWEAILTPDQTTRLRATLDERTRSRSRPVRRYLLTGLLRCGLCDAPLMSRPQANGDRRYVCAKGPQFTGCGRLAIRAELIEAFLVAAILERLDSPMLAAALAGAAEADAATAAEHRALGEDQDQLDDLARRWANREFGASEWRIARDIIEARIDATRRKLSRSSRSSTIDAYVGRASELRAVWPTLPLDRQRSIVSAVLDRAIVRPAVRGRATFDPERIEALWRDA